MIFENSVRSKCDATFLAVLAFLLVPVSARAASVVLEDLEYAESDSEWELRVLFSTPVRYLRHSPQREGAELEIAVDLIGRVNLLDVLGSGPEVLQLPPQLTGLLREVRLEIRGDDRPLLLLRFSREVAFRVEPGADFRSIVIRVRKDAPRAAPPATGANAGTTDEIMAEARSAMVAREYDRAIALYTIVLSSTAGKSEEQLREAREYLGLARQKNGQIAHARAEYEAYLERFPTGDDSDRVRQRLAALSTASTGAPDRLRPAEPGAPTRYDFHGSLYTTYFRSESFSDLSGAELDDSSQLFNLDATGRMRRGDLELRGRASGYLRLQYDDWDASVPSRVTRLYVEGRDNAHGLQAVIGRQNGPGAGVLGRLDGVTGSWNFLPNWSVNAVAGFPLLTSVLNAVQTNHQVYGLSVETRQLVEGLSTELYGVSQFVDGTLDRAAIGIETRYLDERRSAYGLLDFDVHFGELNIAMLSGSWRVTDATTFNGLVDYRYSPFLTTRNALIGQPFGDLDDLENAFSDSQIEDFAKDRTPRVTTLMAGASHRISETLEVNADFTTSKIGKTDSSGGVPGYDTSGWFYYYTAQLINWNWLMDGGTERLRLRIFDGDRYDSYSATVSGRYPLPCDFRLSPAVQFAYRNNQDGRNFIELRPGVRIEYRLLGLVFDTDLALEWLQGVGGGASSQNDQIGYVLSVGARYDF